MKRCPVLLTACILATALSHQGAADTAAGPGATIVYKGETYELRLHGMCGAGPKGGYNIWAVTPDETEPSTAKEGAPRLHAASNGDWSVLKFYEAGPEVTALIRRDGADRVALENGMLQYEGPADDGSGDVVEIHLRC